MNGSTTLQIIITAVLSSGIVGSLLTLFTKKVASPESRNELTKIGNEFAQQLLAEARAEREELRKTITELQNSLISKQTAIERLEELAREKDNIISLLEERQFALARKVEAGERITFYDLFGSYTPPDFLRGFRE